MRRLFKSFFKEYVEHSGWLRLLSLAMTWWSGMALAMVGAEAWAWLGGSLMATVGHAISWRLRRRKVTAVRTFVIVGVVATTGLLAMQMQTALSGNWLPAAQLLAMTQAVASFDLRTRGGLYTVLLLSGTIIFLTSQLAFGSGFIVILAGFFLLFLIFLAWATAIDASQDTIGRRRGSGLVRALTWTGWGGAVVGLGVLFFLLTPWGTLRSGAGIGGTEALLPLTGKIVSASSSTGSQQERIRPVGPDTIVNLQGQDAFVEDVDTPLIGPGGEAAIEGQGDGSQRSDGSQSSGGGSPGAETTQSTLDDVVLRVRSPVASYWRGQSYSNLLQFGQRPDRSVSLERPLGQGLPGQYTQTIYVAQDEALPFLGYSPISWEVVTGSADQDGLKKGTVYQVLSQRRPFNPEALRYIARGVPPDPSTLVGVSPRVVEFAQEIVGRSINLLDRTLAITQYLRDNYQYDPIDEGLGTVASTEEFLFGEGRLGGNVDFATAHALLSRGVGLNARVVTGYLPGEFDPLSGAYIVRQRDAHAWSEVRLPFVGWVPFDASPRTDLPVASGPPGLATRIVNEVFDLQIGDQVREGVGGLFEALLENRVLTSGIGFIISGFTMLWWFAVRYDRSRPKRRRALRYSGLEGKDRRAVLTTFRRVERQLRKYVEPRRPSETLNAYFARAIDALPHLEPSLLELRARFVAAAYGPAAPSRDDLACVRIEVKRLRPAL